MHEPKKRERERRDGGGSSTKFRSWSGWGSVCQTEMGMHTPAYLSTWVFDSSSF